MPGFEKKGFTLEDLSSGLNIIIGPNASGKTTACRAIQGLLWPEILEGISPIALIAEWIYNGERLRLEIEGRNSTCQRGGIPTDRPPLPAPHLAGCFTIGIDALFEGGETDAKLADRVAREMAGGYDLKALRGLDSLKLSRRPGRKSFRKFNEAKNGVGLITAEQQKLRIEEEELEGLEKQEREAREAETRLATLEEAAQLIGIRSEISKVESSIEDLPEEMESLNGDERGKLTQIRSDLETAAKDLGNASQVATKARQSIEELGLPKDGISEVRLNEQRARVNKLREIENKLYERKLRTTEASETIRVALRFLGAEATPEKLDGVDTSGLDEIADFHRKAEENSSTQTALQARLELLGKDESAGKVEDLVSGINLLRQWFEAAPIESQVSRSHIVLIWLLIGLMAGIGTVLALSVNAWWGLLLLPAGMAGVVAWFLKRAVSTDVRRILQEQYERLPLDMPTTWSRDAVGRILNTLEHALAQARSTERDIVQRDDLTKQLEELRKKASATEEQRAELVKRFGVAPDLSPLALNVFATNVIRYQEARTMQAIANTEADELQKEHSKQLTAINTYLTEFDEEECDSYDIARVRTEAVERRAAKYREAKTALTSAQMSIESAQTRNIQLESRRKDFFASLSLEDEDEQGLLDRLALLPKYKKAQGKLTDSRAREAALVNRLEPISGILDLTIEEVHAEIDRLRDVADGHDDLVSKILDIRSRIDSTIKGSRLEDALAKMERARNDLAQHQDGAAFAAAGNLLLDEVEAEYEVEGRPEVLQRASQWLAAFTRGRYELRLGEVEGVGLPAFRAVDTVTGRGHALQELSRGTRIQLLLAVRLAFAMAAERGTDLPLILDEVLSNSDPERFQAIIESVLEMVKNGRQVMYLTCQPSDAIAWEEMAAKLGVTKVSRNDLGDVRLGEGVASKLFSRSTIGAEQVPEPDSDSLDEYAKSLGVPRLDPRACASSAHVAHLVENAGQLYKLLTAGVQTYGQLDLLASFGGVSAYLPDKALERMRARACVLDAFSEAWKVGRGKPVSREILANAGVSESFSDRVTSLARDLEWDAKRLVQALSARKDERAKGFRSSVLEIVIENLQESGHLPTEDPLNKVVVLDRVLAAASEFVKCSVIAAEDVREMCSALWHLATTGVTHD
jgi:hypothetical protein